MGMLFTTFRRWVDLCHPISPWARAMADRMHFSTACSCHKSCNQTKNPAIFELFFFTTTLFSMKNKKFVIQAAILGVNAGIGAKKKRRK
jgi:hypothetical protein